MKCSTKNYSDGILFVGLGLWCLTPLLTILPGENHRPAASH